MDFDQQILTDFLGYVAAFAVFLTFCTRTMLALRLIAILSNVAFISYALAASLVPILILHGALLPLNVLRLIQMQRQVNAVGKDAVAVEGEARFDWLLPMAERRNLDDGALLFAKGDSAESLYVVVNGEIVLPEVDVVLGPGEMLGEIGLFLQDRRRTTSARARGRAELAEVTEKQVEKLYFDNPKFAYRLIRMVTQRLIENLSRLERDRGPSSIVEAGDAPGRSAT